MIASVSGTVLDVSSELAVIEVGGLGLAIQCTPPTLATLRRGEHATVHTSLVVREDSLTLYGFADAEIHVFVEADAQKKVQRLYWVQFEAFLPDNERVYKYPFIEKTTLAGLEFDVNRSYGPTNLKSRPGSDRERVFAMVAKAGYVMPAEQLNVRLVHLTDETKRKELMIIYGEDLAMSKTTTEELNKPGGQEKWEGQKTALIARAKERIKVEQ